MKGAAFGEKHLKWIYASFIYLFLYAPILILIIYSFNDSGIEVPGTALLLSGMSSCFRTGKL